MLINLFLLKVRNMQALVFAADVDCKWGWKLPASP